MKKLALSLIAVFGFMMVSCASYSESDEKRAEDLIEEVKESNTSSLYKALNDKDYKEAVKLGINWAKSLSKLDPEDATEIADYFKDTEFGSKLFYKIDVDDLDDGQIDDYYAAKAAMKKFELSVPEDVQKEVSKKLK